MKYILATIAIFCISPGLALADCAQVESVIQAVADSDDAAVMMALSRGYNPDCKNKDGYTALSAAIRSRELKIIKLLLDENANPNLMDGGASPLYYAILFNCLPCAALIKEHGGKLIARSEQISYLNKYEHVNKSNYWREFINE